MSVGLISKLMYSKLKESPEANPHRQLTDKMDLQTEYIPHFISQRIWSENESKLDYALFELMMVHSILLKPGNFRNATYDKGRTPFHYSVLTPSYTLGMNIANL